MSLFVATPSQVYARVYFHFRFRGITALLIIVGDIVIAALVGLWVGKVA